MVDNDDELQLDDLFEAIKRNKDQEHEAFYVYEQYLDSLRANKSNEEKLKILEQILKLECIEKAKANGLEEDRRKINLKWTTLKECGMLKRKVGHITEAIQCLDKANKIDENGMLYYELGLCHLENGNIFSVKTCFEKTISMCNEIFHWKCLDQLISIYYLLGNFTKSIKYISIGLNRSSMYRVGLLCLNLILRKQPSMKYLIDDTFKDFNGELVVLEDSDVNQFEVDIEHFKQNIFKLQNLPQEQQAIVSNPPTAISTFQDFGQYILKKMKEYSGLIAKITERVDVKSFIMVNDDLSLPDNNDSTITNQLDESTTATKSKSRKKRTSCPSSNVGVDDYEKRRSARSITRTLVEENNIMDKLRRLLGIDDSSSDDEEQDPDMSTSQKTVTIQDNENGLPQPPQPSVIPNNQPVQIDFHKFIQSIAEKDDSLHLIDLMFAYVEELTKHSSDLWSNELRTMYAKLFDYLIDYIQFPSVPQDLESLYYMNHLKSCLCYIENALGSFKSDLTEDSIEKFSHLARLKSKYKSIGYCFGRLQLYYYLIQSPIFPTTIGDMDVHISIRILWISCLYYYLSGDMNDSIACVMKLREILTVNNEDLTQTITIPNLMQFSTISKNTVDNVLSRLKKQSLCNGDLSSSNSDHSTTKLNSLIQRILVTEDNVELESILIELKKNIDRFCLHLMTSGNNRSQQNSEKSLLKLCETLIPILTGKINFNTPEFLAARQIYDQIIAALIDILLRLIDDDQAPNWSDTSFKSLQNLMITLIDSIMKRDNNQQQFWHFKSANPWILLHCITKKRNPKKNERFLNGFVKTVHTMFGKHSLCLMNCGQLLEYFLLELLQLEHSDIKNQLNIEKSSNNDLMQRRLSTTSSSSATMLSSEKSKLSKIIDEAEQCIYCLYGIVLRKSKFKNLCDHQVCPVEFTLKKANIVFYLLKPKELPGYEGRIACVTNETESIFHRFESMIDWDVNREATRLELLAYIEKSAKIDCTNSLNKMYQEQFQLKPFHTDIPLERDLYYLLADYYLKMSSNDVAKTEISRKKARDYYIKDLCFNPTRFDSWAGLTVIKFSEIEKIVDEDEYNSVIFEEYNSAKCFFTQAISIDNNNHTLWMEYGEVTYVLHAYCSKYRTQSSAIILDRSTLLDRCKTAYITGNLCTDNEHKEEWAYLYMSGKIQQKQQRYHLTEYLQKFIQALDILHEQKAQYPRKLGHQNATNTKQTHLAAHALEMFYRIHGTSLKYISAYSHHQFVTLEQLNDLIQLLQNIQHKPFWTSFYERTNVSHDRRSAQVIHEMYFSSDRKFDNSDQNHDWINAYTKCVMLCVDGLYLCIVKYNRHYRALYRLAHFYHTDHYFKNDRLSLDFLIGGKALALEHYPQVTGLFEERTKTNLFNGIWRLQPLDLERCGSFNSSMYKCTLLLIDLLASLNENIILFDIVKQLYTKPEFEKKYLLENERKHACHRTISTLIKKLIDEISSKTMGEIELEALTLIAEPEECPPLPKLFELTINLYNLTKTTEFFHDYDLSQLVQLGYQRYKPILKSARLLPENITSDRLAVIYAAKKKNIPKKRPPAPPPPPPSTNQNSVTPLQSPQSPQKRLCLEQDKFQSNSNEFQDLMEVKSNEKRKRLLRYIPHESKISYELKCEWNQCNLIIQNLNDYYQHLDEHLNDYINNTQQQESINYTCQWSHCGYVEDKFDNSFIRHVRFHGFHTKLKYIGLKTYEQNCETRISKCSISHEHCNMIPDLPDEFQCSWDQCRFSSNHPQLFYEHVNQHMNNNCSIDSNSKLTICRWTGCSHRPDKAYRIREHLRHHTQEKIIACPVCGSLFSCGVKFVEHCQLSSNVLPLFQCEKCSKQFQSKSLLQKHILKHIHKHACPYCPLRTFSSPSCVKRHIIYCHTDIKCFQCPECPLSFKAAYDVRNHWRKQHHLPSQQPIISEPSTPKHHSPIDSNKVIQRPQTLIGPIQPPTSHRRRAHPPPTCMTDEQQYPCRICLVIFSNENDLNVHKAANHKSKEYACHVCFRHYSKGKILTRHLQNKHQLKKPDGCTRFSYVSGVDGFYYLQGQYQQKQNDENKNSSSSMRPTASSSSFLIDRFLKDQQTDNMKPFSPEYEDNFNIIDDSRLDNDEDDNITDCTDFLNNILQNN